jgi:hypothetical protein
MTHHVTAAEALLDGAQPVAQRRFGLVLQAKIHCRLDMQAEVGKLGTVLLFEQPAYVLHVPGSGSVLGYPEVLELQWLGERVFPLLRRNETDGGHAIEHIPLPADRGLRPTQWIGTARRLRQPGEQRGLSERETADIFPEQRLRGGSDAVGAGAEVDVIEVEIEDLVFRELRFELDREDELLCFALEGALRRQEQLFDDLLRDRAGALHNFAVLPVGQHGASDAHQIDPAMLIELGILCGQEGRADVIRDLVDGHQIAPLHVEFPDLRPISGIHPRGGRRSIVEELGHRWQIHGELTPHRQKHQAANQHDRGHAPEKNLEEFSDHGTTDADFATSEPMRICNRTAARSAWSRASPRTSTRPLPIPFCSTR